MHPLHVALQTCDAMMRVQLKATLLLVLLCGQYTVFVVGKTSNTAFFGHGFLPLTHVATNEVAADGEAATACSSSSYIRDDMRRV